MSSLADLLGEIGNQDKVPEVTDIEKPVSYDPDNLSIYFCSSLEDKVNGLQDSLALTNQAEGIIEANEPVDSSLLTTMVEHISNASTEEIDVVPYYAKSTSLPSLGNVEGLKAAAGDMITPEDDNLLSELGVVLEEAILNTTEIAIGLDQDALAVVDTYIDRLRNTVDNIITEEHGVVDINTAPLNLVIEVFEDVGMTLDSILVVRDVSVDTFNLKDPTVLDVLNYVAVVKNDFVEDLTWLVATSTSLATSTQGGEVSLTAADKLGFIKQRHEINRVGKVVCMVRDILDKDLLRHIKIAFIDQD